MKLSKIEILNFRSFESEKIDIGDFTSFVGENGAGKSTVLQAMNIFFRNTKDADCNLVKLSDEDFHMKNTSIPIKISLTFDNLTMSEREDFKAYYRNDKLIISSIASWNSITNSAEVIQVGSRLQIKDFEDCYKEDIKAPELKSKYLSLKSKYPRLPAASTKGDIVDALRSYEEQNPTDCVECQSSSEFYGWSKGENKLKKYISWVYIPAVKNASSEQEGDVINTLVMRTVKAKINFEDQLKVIQSKIEKDYNELINLNSNALRSINEDLKSKFQNWSYPGTDLNINWSYDEKSFSTKEPYPSIKIGENGFLGDIARSGHGLQRSLLITLLQELVELDDLNQPALLLGMEEPELYQHPPQARYMASILEELGGKNSQVFITTHSPYFISSKGYENIRLIRKKSGIDKVCQLSFAKLAKELGDAMGEEPRQITATMASAQQVMLPSLNELFFARIPIIVEGTEDVAYLSTYMKITGKDKDFRKHGCHFIISGGKTNLSRPFAISMILGLNAFAIFDGDQNCNQESFANHVRDNTCILNLAKVKNPEPMSTQNVFCTNVAMMYNNLEYSIAAEIGETEWNEKRLAAKGSSGLNDGITKKNSMLVAAHIEEIMKTRKSIQILDQIIEKIFKLAV